MKTVLFLIALMLVAAPQALAAGKTMVYRNFIWGVSKEDVRRYEKAVFYKEEGNSLYFLLKPDRFRRMIRYDFKGDKLTGIRFEVVEYREAISGNVVNMFYDVEKELTGFYGPPKSEAFWKNKRYQKYPAYWGRPLYSGDLRLKNSWNLPDATVEEHRRVDLPACGERPGQGHELLRLLVAAHREIDHPHSAAADGRRFLQRRSQLGACSEREHLRHRATQHRDVVIGPAPGAAVLARLHEAEIVDLELPSPEIAPLGGVTEVGMEQHVVARPQALAARPMRQRER